jgi:hypothetical protein
MSDQFYYVSIKVSSESRLIKNELLRIDKPLNPEEALEYDEALTEWLKLVPVPGNLTEPAPPPIVDPADLVASRLPKILNSEGKFEEHGPLTTFEQEVEESAKPYDWAKNS